MVSKSITPAPERTHEAVLIHLKRQGQLSVAELCEALKITSMAVRRHLIRLKREGLVISKLVHQSRGRPVYRYSLTPQAESLFPSGFKTLAADILDVVYEQGGHRGVMDLLSARNEKLIGTLSPRMAGKDLRGRIEEVSRIFAENGYMTEWEALADGNFLIFQKHCAVHDLANQYRQMCVLEPQLIERLLGAKVIRQQYMLKDDPVCGYLVQAG